MTTGKTRNEGEFIKFCKWNSVMEHFFFFNIGLFYSVYVQESLLLIERQR